MLAVFYYLGIAYLFQSYFLALLSLVVFIFYFRYNWALKDIKRGEKYILALALSLLCSDIFILGLLDYSLTSVFIYALHFTFDLYITEWSLPPKSELDR